MNEFATFTPILSSDPNDIRRYHEEHNIPAWDNHFFDNYVGPITNPQNNENETKTDEETTQPEYLLEYYRTIKEKVSPVFPEIKMEENKVTIPLKREPKQTNNILEQIRNLDVDDNDKIYLEILAEKESSFQPNVINKYGYQGLYQFGDLALKDIGYTREDLENTYKQHEAALQLAKTNEKRLKNILDTYEGKKFKGIKITRNGIRAAAHLLGAATVKDWFNETKKTKYAQRGFVDANGTHITKYLSMYN